MSVTSLRQKLEKAGLVQTSPEFDLSDKDLTPHQETVLTDLVNTLNSGSNLVALVGAGGVGKTHCAFTLPANYFTATTNTAAGVLQRKLEDAGIYKGASTIHKLLGLRVNYFQGNAYLKAAPKNNLESNLGVVVVDEASMIDKELLRFIIKNAEAGTKYIFIGDPLQLPPVKHSKSPVLSEPVIPVFELREIVRQAKGNPIIDTATNLRDAIENGYLGKIKLNSAVVRVNEEEARNLMFDWFVDNNEDALICAYTNKVVDAYNKEIKLKKFGSEDLFIGEKIIINSAVFDLNNRTKMISTDTVATIRDLKPVKYEGLEGLAISTEEDFTVFRANSSYAENQLKREFKNSKDWKSFYAIQEVCADVRSGYARTTHKAQGSSVDYVLLDLDDIYTAKSDNIKNRLIYVAISRARKGVFVLKR